MKNTKVEYATHTFNPWIGCKAVSAGCRNCFAEKMARRFHWDFSKRVRTSNTYWGQPHKWNQAAAKAGRLDTVLVGTLCDYLDDTVPIRWLYDLAMLIADTPHLFWLLLTKRPENFGKRLGASVWKNVGLGVTVENQAMAELRLPVLLKTPAALRFVSVEPMLEAVDLKPWLWTEADGCRLTTLDWVICGAETGPGAREMDNNWACDLEVQCARAGMPFYFKKASRGHTLVSRREFPACFAGALRQGSGQARGAVESK